MRGPLSTLGPGLTVNNRILDVQDYSDGLVDDWLDVDVAVNITEVLATLTTTVVPNLSEASQNSLDV